MSHAVEDTRVSRKLLEPFGLQPNLISLHEHNESLQVKALIDRLQSGESGALISDAGTPLFLIQATDWWVLFMMQVFELR